VSGDGGGCEMMTKALGKKQISWATKKGKSKKALRIREAWKKRMLKGGEKSRSSVYRMLG